MSRPVLQPSAEHPITVEQSTEKVIVSVGDRVLASSDNALVLREASYAPVYYVPEDDVEPGVLAPSDTTSYCPFKGDAEYVSAPDAPDVGWTYREPYDAVAEIAGHIAFYPSKVEIRVA